MIKKLLLTLVFALFSLWSYWYAQSLPYANTQGLSVGVQHFLPQKRVTAPYTQAQCLANNGVYVNSRIYLSNDVDNNGRKDRILYLMDNVTVNGWSNNVKLYLISADLSNIDYYTPSAVQDILGIRYNGTNYSLWNQHAWYRQSKVVPLNTRVRWVSSEPMFFQAPTTTSLSDRMTQVSYKMTFKLYRNSVSTALNNNFQTFPLQWANDFSSSLTSWYLNNPIPHNNAYGPVWNSDYSQTNAAITTKTIEWWAPIAHGLECKNYYLSRCGDGFIDKTGQQPTNGSTTQPYIIADTGIDELCDPGTSSNWNDDVMPGGVSATENYHCTPTCTIVDTPVSLPNLTIDKQQKLVTGTVFSGVGFGTPSDIAYTSPSAFEFKIIIKNTWGDANNVVMKDVLPAWFVVNALPWGCSGVTSAWANVACNAVAWGQITSQGFNLPTGASATFTIKGMLTSTVPTVNKASASCTPTNNTPCQTPEDTVNQHPVKPVSLPNLTIDKQQKLVTGTVFSGVGFGTPSDIAYTSPSAFEFKIIIKNTWGDANNVVMKDVLPAWFVVNALPWGCSGVTSAWANVACNAVAWGQITSQGFNLPTGASATFTIKGMLTSTVPTVNKASASCTPTNNTPCQTPEDIVKQHPETFIKSDIIYTKKVRNVTTNSNNGQFVEADNLLSWVEVHTGDIVEYEITIEKLAGTLLNTILSDVLPINNGFIMSGYSINGGTMVTTTVFPQTNITTLLNNANVVVKLYGVVWNPTATQFVNTAFLTENWVPVKTKLLWSNVAWTYLPAIKSNPRLRIQKYWINPSNSNQTGDHYIVAQGTPIKFILRVTNIGNVAAAGIIVDNCPTNLVCQSYRILPSTVSVSYSSTIPVGTIPVGWYVEVEVSAVAYPTASNSSIKNIAKLYRVCPLEEDVVDGIKDGLCYENEDDATLDPLSSSCWDGILDTRVGEQCDLGNNMPRTIGRYLDNTTTYPSWSNRGDICTAECKIKKTQASYCWDGIVGRLEQCDMGDGVNPYYGGTIGSYLDNIGRSLPSGQYAGQQCSQNCAIDGKNQPTIPACRYTDTIISVMKDEILPFSQDIELGGENVVTDSNQCTGNEGALIENSLKCTFEIFNRNEEGTNGVSRVMVDAQWCDIDKWWNSRLFMEFYGTNRDGLFVEKPRGTYYLTANEMKTMVGNSLGEYKISLSKVDYQYCKNGMAVTGNPYARVCQVNLAVTDHYLMQKGSTATQTNTKLDNYFLLDGQPLYKATDLNKVDQLTNLNYANLSSSMKSLTDGLIAKYEKIAWTATIGGITAKKVPGQSIYIMEGGKTFNGASLSRPTTIIVNWDVTIVGDIKKNVLLIAKGTVKFNLPFPWERNNGCNAQQIHGIIVAQKWFVASDNHKWYKNTDLNDPRCRKGNLMVYGALIGNNLGDVVASRRSHLEGWFTFNQNGSVLGNNSGEERIKAKRRKDVYEGASVYVEQNPSLWRDIPPGADEFLKTLNISRN